jgi:Ca2+-binding EF-hand superfamily protein
MATAAPDDSGRVLIFLAESRPIFVRLRVMSEGRPFEASWLDSVKAILACLDRDGNGTLTTKEAEPKLVAGLVRLAVGGPAPPAVGELDVSPKDGKVSIDELADGLRSLLGPFQIRVGRQAISRTDALFDQLDRDKDGELTRSELMAIAGSLRPLDLDDNEMISPDELEPFSSTAVAIGMEESADRRSRLAAVPPVVELAPGESSLRPARMLLKKYDRGNGDGPGRPDGKLSSSEFAINPDAFAAADKNADDALDTNELRSLLAKPPLDLTLDVSFSNDSKSGPKADAKAASASEKETLVKRLTDRDVEFAVGKVRLDIELDDGQSAAETSRRSVERRFKAADVNKNGYLEGKELATLNDAQSPFAGLSPLIDRNGDGKLYLKELTDFVDGQERAARARLILTTSDQARALFGILDLDRDRRLGAREIMRTVDRAMTWDSSGDARISADEIPYHFQVTIVRGGLAGLIDGAVAASGPNVSQAAATAGVARLQAGPSWFQKMDRNHDGDVSGREFLGPRDQFDRLDADKDGLIDAEEARAAGTTAGKKP